MALRKADLNENERLGKKGIPNSEEKLVIQCPHKSRKYYAKVSLVSIYRECAAIVIIVKVEQRKLGLVNI